MMYQVTEIEFDFDDEELDDAYKQQITEETLGQIWEAGNVEDLVEEITCATGWCIKSLDYRIVLS